MPAFTGLDPYSLGVGGTLTIEWAPHKDEPLRVAADLDEAALYLEHMRPVLTAARQAVVHDVRDHFDSMEGSGGQWPEGSASGTRAKSQHGKATEAFYSQSALPGDPDYVEFPGEFTGSGGPRGSLVDSGAGKASATSVSSYTIATDGEGGTITFTAMPPHYMLAHNEGLPDRETHGGFFEGPNPLPQREWLWLSEAAGEVIFELFEQFVADAAGIVVTGQGGAVLRGPGGQFVPVNIQGTY